MAENSSVCGRKELSFMVLFSGSQDDSAAEVHPIRQAASIFAESVERRTDGEVTVKIHSVNTLYTQQETLEKAARGIIDMGMATQGALDKYVNTFALVMMPFLYDGYEHAYRVLDGPFKEWVAPLLEQQNMIYLANWEWGFRNITNNVRPIQTPDDVKGLKVRTPPGEAELRAVMEACGADVTEIDLPDLHAALERGSIDGEENPLEVIYRFKFYEVQKYLSLTRHVYNCMVHVMSLRTWKKLTNDQQQVLLEESQKAGNFLRQAIQAEEKKLLTSLQGKGMEIIESPEIPAFRAVMEPAYTRMQEYVGEENVEKFMEMVESLRKS